MSTTERVVCVILLAAAFTIRILPLTWGQPDPQYARSFAPRGMLHEQTPLHPDEYFFTAVPFRKVLEPASNFTFYENPSFLVNVSYVLARLSGVGHGLSAADRAGLNERYYAPFSLYIITRALSALGGVLSVAAVYALARLLAGRRAALVAGLLAVFSLPLVAHAHYGTTSSLAAGFATASLFMALASMRAALPAERAALLIGSGVAIGLAMGNRYNAAVAALGVLIVGLWHLWQMRAAWRWWQGGAVLAAWVAFPIVFIATTPGVILDTAQFLHEIRHVSNMYLGTGIDSILNMDPWAGLAMQLGFTALYGLGGLGAVAALAGGVRLLRGRPTRTAGAVLVAFVVIYALLVMRTVRPQGADQLTVIVLPALAVLAGAGAAWLMRLLPLAGRVLVVMAVAALPIYLSMVHLRVITVEDTREQMQQWIYEHLPRGSSVLLVGPINTALDPADYRWQQVFALPGDVDFSAYAGVDYLLISNALADVRRALVEIPAENLPQGARPMLMIFRPQRLGSHHPMFTSAYFHSPTLRLYCLNAPACDATIASQETG